MGPAAGIFLGLAATSAWFQHLYACFTDEPGGSSSRAQYSFPSQSFTGPEFGWESGD